mmetsp:Transcript_31001/g.56318  ORF Transcript_31001/g.56318 Transcript_31001/m.56318 type:complete len:91 (-) Transcript_31001:312-584(-)
MTPLCFSFTAITVLFGLCSPEDDELSSLLEVELVLSLSEESELSLSEETDDVQLLGLALFRGHGSFRICRTSTLFLTSPLSTLIIVAAMR